MEWVLYTPPSNTKPALPTYLFGCAPPSSIMDKLLSLSHEKKTRPESYLQRLRVR